MGYLNYNIIFDLDGTLVHSVPDMHNAINKTLTQYNLANISANTSASRSRIMDADYAAESANLAKAQIMMQAATAMLSQANAAPQSVLSLLQ